MRLGRGVAMGTACCAVLAGCRLVVWLDDLDGGIVADVSADASVDVVSTFYPATPDGDAPYEGRPRGDAGGPAGGGGGRPGAGRRRGPRRASAHGIRTSRLAPRRSSRAARTTPSVGATIRSRASTGATRGPTARGPASACAAVSRAAR